MNVFYFSICLVFTGGLLQFFVQEKNKVRLYSFFTGAGCLSLILFTINGLIQSKVYSVVIKMNDPVNRVQLLFDPLSFFFILIIAGIGLFSVIYSLGYYKSYFSQNRPVSAHLFFYSSLIINMILVTIIRNALGFLITWEFMSISSFFLIVFENEKKEVVNSGINYLIQMHIGFLALASAFILLWVKTGSLDFSDYLVFFSNEKGVIKEIIIILFFIGFGLKAGFIPFHTWLPQAHPAAPSPISGLMSGVMIKTGIYGILRVISFIGQPSLFFAYLVLVISLISGFFGIIYAMGQRDIKRVLAYCSVENIGIIGIGLGTALLGMVYNDNLMIILGFAGSFWHILNHSLFKSLLFFGTGTVYQKTHTRDMEKMGGLIKKLPYTSASFLIGAAAICGLPPFNGFISELLIYMGLFKGLTLAKFIPRFTSISTISFFAFIGAMAVICFTKLYSTVFLGQPRKTEKIHKVNEAELSMFLPMITIAALCLVIVIFPWFFIKIITEPVLYITGIDQLPVGFISAVNTLSTISIYFCAFLIMCVVLFLARIFLLKGKIKKYKVWDCGYQAGNARMQYTGSSFSRSFLTLVKPLINYKIASEPAEGLFPDTIKIETHLKDFIEAGILTPVKKQLSRFLTSFKWIQSGNTQNYILYGLVFLILTLIIIIGVK